MNPSPDYALTLVLLAPMLAAGAAALASRGYTAPRRRPTKRLTDGELRRRYPITARRAGKFQSR